MLRRQSLAQARRRRDPDAGIGAAPVESGRDGAREVLLPRLREDQPGAGTVPCRCKRLGWPKPAGDDHVREVRPASAPNRQAERYALEGVPIALSTMADALGLVCEALAPLLGLIEATVKAAARP